MLSNQRLQCGLFELVARAQHHERRDRLDPFVVRQPDHRDFRHGGVGEQHFLHFPARDEDTTGVDHVADAIDDVQVPFLVEIPDIAGMEPPAGERLRGFRRLFPVADHQMRRAVHDFAVRAGRHVVHVRIDDPGLHVQARTPAGGRACIVFLRTQNSSQRRDLGLAITVVGTCGRQPLAQLLQYRDGHDRRAIIDFFQRGQIAGGKIRMPQQG